MYEQGYMLSRAMCRLGEISGPATVKSGYQSVASSIGGWRTDTNLKDTQWRVAKRFPASPPLIH